MSVNAMGRPVKNRPRQASFSLGIAHILEAGAAPEVGGVHAQADIAGVANVEWVVPVSIYQPQGDPMGIYCPSAPSDATVAVL